MALLRIDDDLVEFAAYDALEETGLASAEQRPLANQFWAAFIKKVKAEEKKLRVESAKSFRDGTIAGVAFGLAFSVVRFFLLR